MDQRFSNRPPHPKLNVLPENPDPKSRGRFPSWLHRKLPKGGNLWKTHAVLDENRLPTVCEEARCPNLLECYSKKTATFLVMGSACTRSCGFCDIDFAKNPLPLEKDEPKRLARSVKALGLSHVVITMVARDDLEDGGAAHLASIIRAVREENTSARVEVLTSDFAGNLEALDTVLNEKPEIFNHNIETVRSLTPRVRHKATYDRTLQMLRHAKKSALSMYVKSGFMVGLGESQEEVHETLRDLHATGVEIVTIGQYLQPNRRKLLVKSFPTPDEFNAYAEYGKSIGIPFVYSGPFVRSSYNAAEVFSQL